jgi:hypothetical protein
MTFYWSRSFYTFSSLGFLPRLVPSYYIINICLLWACALTTHELDETPRFGSFLVWSNLVLDRSIKRPYVIKWDASEQSNRPDGYF